MKTEKTIQFARFLILFFGFTIIYAEGYAQFNVPANYSTIQEAIDAAVVSGGGTVYVDDGIYYENITIYDNVYVISKNENPELAIIDASGSGDIVVFSDCLNGGIMGFTLQNGGRNGQFSGVKIAGDQAPTVAKNIIMTTKNGIKVQGDAQPLIINNTIVNNTENGILAGGNSPATIINNIIAYNVDTGISVNGKAIDLLEYNCVYGNGINYDNINPGKNDISEDPLFVASDDFHLQGTSPCKNSGNTFNDEATDMGAYGGDINIGSDYLTEMHVVDGDVVTNLGVSILIPGTKKATAKTTVTRVDRATYGLNKRKKSDFDAISYIVFTEVSEGDVTFNFAATGFDESTIEVYKIDIENAQRVLQGTSTTVTVNYADVNGIWMVKGQKSATSIENPEFSDVSIYPNPSNGTFNINLNDENNVVQIEVKDLAGRTVYNKPADKKQVTMNLNERKGIFILKISNENEVFARKIVVY